ncbi:cyclin-dependent kinase inhibitor 1C-like [Bactrocera tryoni]|uniref:cyclin-dependent kinase inhibitor 1C-like n=1 Tax=Bactrocera tryoni TaxID=59916 RepID=UPI001A96B067|nr:cyclin-dependent kinase inhibitor 1C-like [Bactrocera tryoni]
MLHAEHRLMQQMITMEVDTPVTTTPTARATNAPRTGPSPAPRTVVATTSATAPATTPPPVPATAPAAALQAAPRGGTRPPSHPSRTLETLSPHHTLLHRSAARELTRTAIHRGRIPRIQPASRGAPQRSGTSLRRRQPGPPPRRSTGLSSVVATLQQLQRLLG